MCVVEPVSVGTLPGLGYRDFVAMSFLYSEINVPQISVSSPIHTCMRLIEGTPHHSSKRSSDVPFSYLCIHSTVIYESLLCAGCWGGGSTEQNEDPGLLAWSPCSRSPVFVVGSLSPADSSPVTCSSESENKCSPLCTFYFYVRDPSGTTPCKTRSRSVRSSGIALETFPPVQSLPGLVSLP